MTGIHECVAPSGFIFHRKIIRKQSCFFFRKWHLDVGAHFMSKWPLDIDQVSKNDFKLKLLKKNRTRWKYEINATKSHHYMYYSSILELFVYQISQVHWITKEFEPEINLKINILTRNVSFTACMILILR